MFLLISGEAFGRASLVPQVGLLGLSLSHFLPGFHEQMAPLLSCKFLVCEMKNSSQSVHVRIYSSSIRLRALKALKI